MTIAYMLLSHGPKPKAPLPLHPAAKQQYANLQRAFQKAGKQTAMRYAFDHSRRFECLADLPKLEKVLIAAKDAGDLILIDDFRRLIAGCAASSRTRLYKELSQYGEHFADLRTAKRIGQLSHVQIIALCAATPPIKFVYAPVPRKPTPPLQRKAQTKAASEASRQARTEAADKKAQTLWKLRNDMLEERDHVTLQEIADQTNAQGLLTNHKKEWTASAVSRSLRRLENKI